MAGSDWTPGEGKNKEGRAFPFGVYPELRAVLEAQRSRVREMERTTGSIIPWVFPKNTEPSWYRTNCLAQGASRRGHPRPSHARFQTDSRPQTSSAPRLAVSRNETDGPQDRGGLSQIWDHGQRDVEEAVAKVAAFGNSQSSGL